MEVAMAIRQILFYLPTYPDAPASSTLESAVFLAQSLGAKITGFVSRLNGDPSSWPSVPGAWPMDVPGLMTEAVRTSDANATRLAEEMNRIATEFGVNVQVRTNTTTLYAPQQPLFDFARIHDLLVLPVPESDSFERDVINSAIFNTGRPTLLLPGGRGHKPLCALKTIVVAWDFSREAARALGDALPILQNAGRVQILSVLGEKDIDTACSIGDLQSYLNEHGVNFTLEEARLTQGTIAELIAFHVTCCDADMLVMGAYGHSRTQEFVLGGATRGMIADPPLPLFLSH
jgi:nucleotide-binding universal stress UspA family protein